MPRMVNLQLREARTRAGLSQEGLARLCGISLGAYAAIERGDSQPKLATAQALARALGSSIDALFPEESPEEVSA